jgi:polyketide biosynthesis enoyl-CoA hydratase PksH
MDFQAVNGGEDAFSQDDPNGYYEVLKFFSCCSKVIISKVEGKVNAGGIGLVAASDIVIADEKANFGLSEALFGLLPACVMPFLIRRTGYQKALWMTLTTQGIPASRAYQIGLVDEVSTNVSDAVRKNLLRLTRLETGTIRELKEYMAELWIMDESTQRLAVNRITSLVQSEKVRHNIRNFVNNGKFPWDK